MRSDDGYKKADRNGNDTIMAVNNCWVGMHGQSEISLCVWQETRCVGVSWKLYVAPRMVRGWYARYKALLFLSLSPSLSLWRRSIYAHHPWCTPVCRFVSRGHRWLVAVFPFVRNERPIVSLGIPNRYLSGCDVNGTFDSILGQFGRLFLDKWSRWK